MKEPVFNEIETVRITKLIFKFLSLKSDYPIHLQHIVKFTLKVQVFLWCHCNEGQTKHLNVSVCHRSGQSAAADVIEYKTAEFGRPRHNVKAKAESHTQYTT